MFGIYLFLIYKKSEILFQVDREGIGEYFKAITKFPSCLGLISLARRPVDRWAGTGLFGLQGQAWGSLACCSHICLQI